MDKPEFEDAVYEAKPEGLSSDALKLALEFFCGGHDGRAYTHADVSTLILLAGKHKLSETKAPRRIGKPISGNTERIVAMLFRDTYRIAVEGIRQKQFGSPLIPFNTDEDAIEWIERTAKKDKEQAQRLAEAGVDLYLLQQEPLYYPVRSQISKAQGALFIGAMALAVTAISNQTGFQPEMITWWILRGIEPVIERLEAYDESIRTNVSRRFKMKLILNSPDITRDELWSMYKKIRALPIAKRQEVTDLQFGIFQLVRERGYPPTKHREKGKFWNDIRMNLNDVGFDEVPGTNEGIRKAYNDLMRSIGFNQEVKKPKRSGKKSNRKHK